MQVEFVINKIKYSIDSGHPIDISIPLDFKGEQPNIYNAEKASSKACEIGSFIGDTRRGGSCNFEEYRLIAHCNGTHTECAGHITDERISIQKVLKDAFIPTTLITIEPEKALDTPDSYDPKKNESDRLITCRILKDALESAEPGFLEGLVIRTIPNDNSKKSRKYMDTLPPFLSKEGVEFIVKLGVKHLLLDIPSVDRAFDEGKLSAHHIYWNIEQGSHSVDSGNYSPKTITEMVYAGNEVMDGPYLLNIQIAPFVSDASPSRPVLFQLTINNKQ
ncbi:MAG: cyclase family protein [Ignavibacteria bacterium]